MAESFSRTLDHKWHAGLITGIKFGNGVKNVNHSQFADDTLLMGGTSNIIAQRFKSILDKFMLYSGGLVNFQKSWIYGWNVTSQTIHSIAHIFGVPYKLNWDHFTYLGMPVSAGPLKSKDWDILIEKMKIKFQQWGSSFLNFAGCIVLLKSGLSALPLYQITLLQAPVNIHHKFEAILRHFLWQGGKNERKNTTLSSGDRFCKITIMEG